MLTPPPVRAAINRRSYPCALGLLLAPDARRSRSPRCRLSQHTPPPPRTAQKAVVYFFKSGLEISCKLCYNPSTIECGCSSSVELRLPKPIRWVRLPSSAPRKKPLLPWRAKEVSCFERDKYRLLFILFHAVHALPLAGLFFYTERIYCPACFHVICFQHYAGIRRNIDCIRKLLCLKAEAAVVVICAAALTGDVADDVS